MLFILIQQNILIIYFLNDTTSLNGPDIFATYFLDYSDLVLLLGQYVIMHFFFSYLDKMGRYIIEFDVSYVLLGL